VLRVQSRLAELAVPGQVRVLDGSARTAADAAAAGVYSGIILDARTGLPHGTLCVRILPT